MKALGGNSNGIAAADAKRWFAYRYFSYCFTKPQVPAKDAL